MNSSVAESIAASVQIIDAVYETVDGVMYVALSGGRDSAVILDLMSRSGHNYGVMCIDTGLSADGWRDDVMRLCRHYGKSPEFVKGSGRNWYTSNVLAYGFGYTPAQHTVYYRMLKGRAIQAHVKAVKRHWRDRVVYFTGVRRDESAKRSKTPYWYRHGARCTVNPIAHWSQSDIDSYHSVLMPHYRNTSYALYGSSGDCFCGWTRRNTAGDFAADSPDLHAYLVDLESQALERGLWRYGGLPDDDILPACDSQGGDDMTHGDLCHGCTKR